ncbi:hypothetical protein BDB00DRAFT_809374 [Zychaea mexicana]|uniref:uncharacterized protein n=1 Tax=Zychaea mexicana TaxID=64656 RepID=UPI0022FF4511|nr:uncharacterized protein BDB00DRAFT_809374 [Zychaea mexicana]KAI9496559.1 hypothetical protein BDB00DRAFT_809374 [Zychaea mexicana]
MMQCVQVVVVPKAAWTIMLHLLSLDQGPSLATTTTAAAAAAAAIIIMHRRQR